MASVNIFLKLKLNKGGLVKGAANIAGHEGEVLLESFRWGEESTAAIGGKGGACIVRNFEFTKKMCPGSVQLLLACAMADPVVEAVISFRGVNAEEKMDFLTWTLTDGILCSYETEANVANSVVPLERVCIRFRAMVVEYKLRNADGTRGGTLSARIDVGANIASS